MKTNHFPVRISRIIIFLFFPFSSFFFVSCEEDNVDYGLDAYYQNLAVVLNDSVYMLDSGETIYSTNYKTRKSLETGKRVFLTYSYLPEQPVVSYDRAVVVHGFSEITSGQLQAVSKKEVDELPVEPVRLQSAWLGGRYLNMQFYINWKSTPHSIGLLTDSTRLQADTVSIYFKHDLNGDLPGSLTHLFVSFDLADVLGAPGNEKPLLVHINTSNYANKIYKFNY
jgi:hypothetical protein